MEEETKRGMNCKDAGINIRVKVKGSRSRYGLWGALSSQKMVGVKIN